MKNDSDLFTALPTVMTDKSGTIIYVNEAAHDICAAFAVSENIFPLFPDLPEKLRLARASGCRSFFINAADSPCGDVVFDLSKEDRDSVWRLLPGRSLTDTTPIAYSEIKTAFAEICSASGLSASRRYTALYDSLVAADSVFSSHKEKRPYKLRELMASFVDAILPKLRHFGCDLLYREGASVDANCLAETDIYSFHLTLSAICAAVGFASGDAVVITADHSGDRAIVTVSADIRERVTITDTASFGVHAPDVIYAETLSRACGYELSWESVGGKLTFHLRVRADSYYPSWLKKPVSAAFMLDTSAELAARIFKI